MQNRQFCDILGDLRRQKGISQRRAATDLHISQALLSHYENGAREPGLSFVCRACDYYGVTADYILGRSAAADDNVSPVVMADIASELRRMAERLEQLAE